MKTNPLELVVRKKNPSLLEAKIRQWKQEHLYYEQYVNKTLCASQNYFKRTPLHYCFRVDRHYILTKEILGEDEEDQSEAEQQGLEQEHEIDAEDAATVQEEVIRQEQEKANWDCLKVFLQEEEQHGKGEEYIWSVLIENNENMTNGWNFLHDVCRFGHFQVLQFFFEKVEKCLKKNSTSEFAYLFSKELYVKLSQLLLQQTAMGNIPLQIALRHRFENIACYLLEKHIFLISKLEESVGIEHLSKLFSNLNFKKHTILHTCLIGDPLPIFMNQFISLLEYICMNRNLPKFPVPYLIVLGKNKNNLNMPHILSSIMVETKDIIEASVLHYFCAKKDDIMTSYLERFLRLNYCSAFIHQAIPKVMEYKDEAGNTCLHYAVSRESLRCMGALLEICCKQSETTIEQILQMRNYGKRKSVMDEIKEYIEKEEYTLYEFVDSITKQGQARKMLKAKMETLLQSS